MATTTEPDFAQECREAFARMAAEHAAIKPRGYDSQRARAAKHAAIDRVLDQFLQHVAVMEHEAEFDPAA